MLHSNRAAAGVPGALLLALLVAACASAPAAQPKAAASAPVAAKLWTNYLLGRQAQDILYAADAVDHHLLPGSRNAAELERLQATGVKFTELDVAFAQRNDEQQRGRMLAELQRQVQKR